MDATPTQPVTVLCVMDEAPTQEEGAALRAQLHELARQAESQLVQGGDHWLMLWEGDAREAVRAARQLRESGARLGGMGLSQGMMEATARDLTGRVIEEATLLASLAAPGEVLLGHPLARQLDATFALEARPPLSDPLPMLRYAVQGEQFSDRSGREAAARSYRQALEGVVRANDGSAKWPPLRLMLHETLGQVLLDISRHVEAGTAFDLMRGEAKILGDRAAEGRALRGLTYCFERQGAYRRAMAYAEEAETLAVASRDEVALVQTWLRRVTLLYRLGSPQAAQALAERAMELSTRLGAKAERARSLYLIGWMLIVQAQDEAAERSLRHALTLYKELGGPSDMVNPLNLLGERARMRGDYAGAIQYYEEAMGIAQATSHWERQLVYRSNLGGTQVGLEQYATAEANLREVLHHAEALGRPLFLSETYRFLAEACLGQGKVAQALEAVQQAMTLSEVTERREHIGAAWRVLGMVASRARLTKQPIEQDPVEAFARSLRIFAELGAAGEQARTLREWAKHQIAMGDHVHGAAMWQQARENFTRLKMEHEVQRMEAPPYYGRRGG